MLDTGVTTITDALATAGVPVPATTDDLPRMEQVQHIWVQAQQGVDWVDLDPTLVGAQVGQTGATPVTTDLATLPDELRHRVEFRVTAEQISGTGVTQDVILAYIDFADQLGGMPMALLHETPDGLAGIGVSIGSALAGTAQYQPIIQVGDSAHVGQVGLAFPTGDGGVLSGLGSGQRDGEATAEWLEVVTVAPDGGSSTSRRVLFDRIGADVRAAGPIDVTDLPAPEMVQLEPDGPAEFPALRVLHFLAVATGSTSPSIFSDLDTTDQSAWPLHVTGHLYHLARDAANALVAAPQGVRLFHDAPNIVRFSVEPVAGVTDGAYATAMDILHRSFHALPVTGATAALPPSVVAGVLSHALERVAFGGAAADPSADVSVGAIFDLAAAQGCDPGHRPDDPIGDLAWPAAAMATLGAALAAGLVVITPERPVAIGGQQRIGWWTFDPSSGAVADQLDDGRGAAMLEYIGNVVKSFLARHPYIKMGLCIALILKTLASMFQGMSGGSPLLFALGVAGALSPINTIACG